MGEEFLIKGAEVMAISNPYYTKEIIGFVCSDTCFEVYKPKYMERFGL